MAYTDLVAVMKGIEERLATIPDLRTSAYVADQINPPQAVVAVPPIDNYRMSFGRGTFSIRPQIYVFVSAALDRVGQQALAEFANPAGSRSIAAAIEADRTLGGVVQECVVESFRPLGFEEVGQLGYYGGVFEIRVIGSGT